METNDDCLHPFLLVRWRIGAYEFRYGMQPFLQTSHFN